MAKSRALKKSILRKADKFRREINRSRAYGIMFYRVDDGPDLVLDYFYAGNNKLSKKAVRNSFLNLAFYDLSLDRVYWKHYNRFPTHFNEEGAYLDDGELVQLTGRTQAFRFLNILHHLKTSTDGKIGGTNFAGIVEMYLTLYYDKTDVTDDVRLAVSEIAAKEISRMIDNDILLITIRRTIWRVEDFVQRQIEQGTNWRNFIPKRIKRG